MVAERERYDLGGPVRRHSQQQREGDSSSQRQRESWEERRRRREDETGDDGKDWPEEGYQSNGWQRLKVFSKVSARQTGESQTLPVVNSKQGGAGEEAARNEQAPHTIAGKLIDLQDELLEMK